MKSARQKILFIHQNFPGQFRHLAPELQRDGYDVLALGDAGRGIPSVSMVRYRLPAAKVRTAKHLSHFDRMADNGIACAEAMLKLRQTGYQPDLVFAHPGWGEALFVKDIWPKAKLIVFHEFYYSFIGSDVNFDPEFPIGSVGDAFRIRLKNSHLLHSLIAADGILAPTQWQQRQLPAALQQKSTVIFDGVDTSRVAPEKSAYIELSRLGRRLTRGDEIITFVNRNLEPYRGFHVFMRALPEILRRRPSARVVIVGGDEVSYGALPAQGGTWRKTMLAELAGQLPMERIHFVGKLPYDNYLRVLQVSACHVYLTYPFVLGWSCVEAMSVGCNIVGSATPPVQELMTDGVHGRLVDFFDKDGLVDRVCDTLENRADLASMRQRARQRVVEQYDLQRECLPRQMAYVRSFL